MNAEGAKRHLEALGQEFGIEKCRRCEFLQGAIMQIRLDWVESRRMG